MIFFGELEKVEWLSYIKLDKVREAQIQSCFKFAIELHYPTSISDFENTIQEFKVRSTSNNEISSVESFYGESKKRD